MSSYIAELGIDTAYASTMRDNEEALEQRYGACIYPGVPITKMATWLSLKVHQAAARF